MILPSNVNSSRANFNVRVQLASLVDTNQKNGMQKYLYTHYKHHIFMTGQLDSHTGQCVWRFKSDPIKSTLNNNNIYIYKIDNHISPEIYLNQSSPVVFFLTT